MLQVQKRFAYVEPPPKRWNRLRRSLFVFCPAQDQRLLRRPFTLRPTPRSKRLHRRPFTLHSLTTSPYAKTRKRGNAADEHEEKERESGTQLYKEKKEQNRKEKPNTPKNRHGWYRADELLQIPLREGWSRCWSPGNTHFQDLWGRDTPLPEPPQASLVSRADVVLTREDVSVVLTLGESEANYCEPLDHQHGFHYSLSSPKRRRRRKTKVIQVDFF